MKRVAFLIGIGLLAMAFLVTSAELAARVILGGKDGGGSAFMSTQLVWRTVAPHSFLLIHNNTYWPIVKHLLVLPGWLLFGVPGLALGIVFRKRESEELIRQHDRAYEDSLFLYEQLADAAQREGFKGEPDDFTPSALEDTIPAEQHFAADLVEGEFLPERDFLLGPAQPPSRDRSHDN